MTLRQYLFLMLLGSILCWIAWGLVLINIDPFEGNQAGFLFFYTTLFCSLVGTISVMIFFLYHRFSRVEMPLYRYVQKSFRDGVIGAAAICGVLFLQAQSLLSLWNLIILFFILLFIILFRLSTKVHTDA